MKTTKTKSKTKPKKEEKQQVPFDANLDLNTVPATSPSTEEELIREIQSYLETLIAELRDDFDKLSNKVKKIHEHLWPSDDGK